MQVLRVYGRLWRGAQRSKTCRRMLAFMLRLTRAPNLALAHLWAHALSQEGIVASVQREFLAGVAGQLPPHECLPEVWIDHPEQEGRARQVLHDLQHVPQQRWVCECGERVEGGFEQCWRCGRWMPR